MPDATRKTTDKQKPRRVNLRDVIAAGVAKLGGVIGWELRKRRGKPELYVEMAKDDDNLTSTVEKP
jgi:hypothetical protein